MAKEDVARFLDELDGNEKAKALLQASGADLDDEEGFKVLASVAREIGYDVTDDEVVEVFKSRRAVLVKASDAAADECRQLSDDEMDKVAGGGDRSNCSDTYKEGENCWWEDNCKKAIIMYSNPDDPYCDSYSYCKGVSIKPDCKLGRIGV